MKNMNTTLCMVQHLIKTIVKKYQIQEKDINGSTMDKFLFKQKNAQKVLSLAYVKLTRKNEEDIHLGIKERKVYRLLGTKDFVTNTQKSWKEINK